MTEDPGPEVMRQIAATTDAELAAEIRAAATEALREATLWHATPGWRAGAVRVEREAWKATQRVAGTLAALPPDATMWDLQDAVRPMLGAWWPPRTPVDAAVERLRKAAMHDPAWVRDARQIVSQPGWEDW